MWNNRKQQQFSFMWTLQTYYHFKLDFQKVDQHTGGKSLIHGTKRRKDNQLQSLELPTYRRQVVNPRHQTPQGQSVAKPGTPE